MENEREQWKTQTGFIMAAVGSAVGLGNLWRFPYMAYENGGGAFLVPYLVALITAGFPLMLLEYGIGQKMRSSAPMAYAKIDPRWEWLGWWCVLIVMFGIVLYYNVIISWCLHYFLHSFTLPWKDDPNAYFFTKHLHASDTPGEIGLPRVVILCEVLVIWGINWFIGYMGVQKGIERASKLFIPLLFLLTSILVVWGLQLDGAIDGVKAYLTPDFEKIKGYTVWLNAYGQIFFSLSIGFGIMIAYASYLPRNSNLHLSAFITCLVNSFYSIFAGLAVFSVLGYMSFMTGKPLEEVVSKGIGLAFVAYPQAIELIPILPQFFSAIFFLILVVAGLSSSISIIEAFNAALMDKFQVNRRRSVTMMCCLGFLGSVIFTTRGGLCWLDILDHFINNYGLITVGVLESILIGWVLGADEVRQFINENSRIPLGRWWNWVIKFFIPIVLGYMIVLSFWKDFQNPYEGYPWYWLLLIGVNWLMGCLIAAFIIARRRAKQVKY